MARSKSDPPVRRGLSTHAAINAIRAIEFVLVSFEATAPRTFAALGGRRAIKFDGLAVGQTETAIGILGPVPRLDEQTWEQMSLEYYDGLRRHGFTNPGKGTEGPNPPAGQCAPAGGPGFGGAAR
jgi:hypothetical protein